MNNKIKINNKLNIMFKLISILAFSYFNLFINIYAANTNATDNNNQTLGDILMNIVYSFKDITVLLFSVAVLAGLCFAIIAMFKFKQFRDNPQQVTIGQPIGLLMLGVMMLWLPYIILSLGETFTGSEKTEKETQSRLDDNPEDNTGFNKFRIK